MPVEAFEAGIFVGLPPSCLVLETEGGVPFVCGNPVTFDEALAGECPFIC